MQCAATDKRRHRKFRASPRVLLIACAALLILLSPRSTALEPSFPAQSLNWVFRKWELADGLPENSATAAAQTPDGYLWFGTFDGLVRFDGVRFAVFDRSNTPQLPGAMIVNLHLDRQDRLWVSTDKGIVYLKAGKWSAPFDRARGWTADFARTFAEGAGKLFVTSFNGKLFQFENERFQELPEPPGESGRGYFGHVDSQGRFWVAQHQFIGFWDGQQWNRGMIGDWSFKVDFGGAGPARDGGWWLFDGQRLAKLVDGQIVNTIQLESPAPGAFWSLTEDSHHEIWIASFKAGLTHVSPDGKVERITTTNGLTSDAIRFIFEDRERNNWVGSSGGGLLRLKRGAFFTFDQTDGLPNENLRSVAVTRSNEILIGVYGGGLARLTDAGISRVPIASASSDEAYVDCVLVDSRDRIWVGTYQQGLTLIEGKATRLIPTRQSAGLTISALFEDSQKRIWIAGNNGVSVCEGEEFTVHQTLDSVRSFAEEPDTGAIWLGDSTGGLHRFHAGTFENFKLSGNPIGSSIRALLAEPGGTLWIGSTGGGLGVLRGGRYVQVTKTGNHTPRRIGSILPDETGHFWMGTDQGICRASRAELLEVADGQRSDANWQRFDQHDFGLTTKECATVGCPGSARDSLGKLWFPTAKGLAMLSLQRFQVDTNPPPVLIESLNFIDRHGKPRSLAQLSDAPLLIPPGSRALSIEFAALNFAAPSKTRIITRITRDGQEMNASETDRRVVAFDWLPPGNYAVHIAAANQFGFWNSKGATLQFRMLPFFWQTTSFYLTGAFVLFLGATAVVWRIISNKHRLFAERLAERIRGEEALQQEHTLRLEAERQAHALSQRLLAAQEIERSRVARELHDDVTQRLARLAIDAAQSERSTALPCCTDTTRSMRDELVLLSEDVHRLAYRLHPIILEELGLVEALHAECDRFSQQNPIQTAVKPRDIPRDLPREIAFVLFRVAQEALSNVRRHARAKSVEVSLTLMDGGVQLAVRDDGVGFDSVKNHGRPSLGHASMRERVSLVKGDLDIESAPGHGTTILVWIPLPGAIPSANGSTKS